METILGIDLGTTNSEVAIIQGGQPVVLREDGDPILPSFVGLTEDGKLLVGKAARNQYALFPERTVKSIKRKMGQDVKVQLGTQEYRPQEISALILRRLKERAETHLGRQVKKAVITVPAYFNDQQRQATREAGDLAGLEVVRILNEPTAASLTYDPNQEELQRMLVYDLGGGTFDVSIVQVQDGVVEVLASHGDTQLGGDDFDDLLLGHVCNRFQELHGVDLRSQPVSHSRVLRAVEAAKRHLSDFPYARIEEEFIAEKDGQALHLSMEVSRHDFEQMIDPLLERTLDCLRRALEDARLTPSALKKVILVGGSTRTPRISALLQERLLQPVHQEVNPDLCVAMGAAIQGGIIAGESVGAVLVDITPHTLGIKCLGGTGMGFGSEYYFGRIIHRNTSLPTSRSEAFYTVQDEQTSVDVDVYQGEADDVRRNNRVGRFRIEGLARVPAGNELLVQLDLNLDGVLKVTASEKATGLQKQIVIENALAKFQREERGLAEERLEQLWSDQDENEDPDFEDTGDNEAGDIVVEASPATLNDLPQLVPGPREGQRETVQARALLEKAERLLDKISAEDRVELERLMGRVRNAMTDRQWDLLGQTCNDLGDTLFYLEDA